MKNKFRSYIHVILQFGAIAFLLFTSVSHVNVFLLIPIVIGFAIGLWSVWVMQKSKLSIFPDPQPGFKLVKKGPYMLIRHPMYLALFLVLMPLVINNFSVVRGVVLVVFSINQVIKMEYEEQMLIDQLPEYQSYRKITKKIVPYIY